MSEGQMFVTLLSSVPVPAVEAPISSSATPAQNTDLFANVLLGASTEVVNAQARNGKPSEADMTGPLRGIGSDALMAQAVISLLSVEGALGANMTEATAGFSATPVVEKQTEQTEEETPQIPHNVNLAAIIAQTAFAVRQADGRTPEKVMPDTEESIVIGNTEPVGRLHEGNPLMNRDNRLFAELNTAYLPHTGFNSVQSNATEQAARIAVSGKANAVMPEFSGEPLDIEKPAMAAMSVPVPITKLEELSTNSSATSVNRQNAGRESVEKQDSSLVETASAINKESGFVALVKGDVATQNVARNEQRETATITSRTGSLWTMVAQPDSGQKGMSTQVESMAVSNLTQPPIPTKTTQNQSMQSDRAIDMPTVSLQITATQPDSKQKCVSTPVEEATVSNSTQPQIPTKTTQNLSMQSDRAIDMPTVSLQITATQPDYGQKGMPEQIEVTPDSNSPQPEVDSSKSILHSNPDVAFEASRTFPNRGANSIQAEQEMHPFESMDAAARPSLISTVGYHATANGKPLESQTIREAAATRQSVVEVTADGTSRGENLSSTVLKKVAQPATSESFSQNDGSASERGSGAQDLVAPFHQLKIERTPDVVKTSGVSANEPVRSHVLDQVISQIKEHVTVREIKNSSSDQIVLRLSPENLGELKLNLRMENQSLRLEIVTESSTVRETLLKHSDTLRDTLARQNIFMDSFDVSTGSGGNGLMSQNRGEWQELARQQRFTAWNSTGRYVDSDSQATPKREYLQASTEYSMVDVHF